jgi:DNA invertase Pin-like site-specific DNA recombinase
LPVVHLLFEKIVKSRADRICKGLRSFQRHVFDGQRQFDSLNPLQLGIDFVSVTEAVDTSLPAGELVFQMIGAVAQFERSLIGERVRSGLANAKAKGKLLGRPPLRSLTPQEVKELRRQRKDTRISYRELAKAFSISVWSAHRLCRNKKKGLSC